MWSLASSRRTAARRPRRRQRAWSHPSPSPWDKDRSLEEMDLDALLARRPRFALVDELAHTNAAGSRHPKRCIDVEELFDNGIDVYSTLNIQHIESLTSGWPRSRASASARRCPTRSSTGPTISSSSTSRQTI